MSINVVEYIHEFSEPDWEYVKTGDGAPVYTERVDFTSYVTQPYYAVQEPYEVRTDVSGLIAKDIFNTGSAPWIVGGTNLTLYTREDVLGYIGLLNRLLDEFPEKGE